LDNRIQHIIERWYLSEPALFQIFGTHNLEKNDKISCPFRCGKGVIEYSPKLIEGLNHEALELYLKAEIIRILLKHPYDRQPDLCKRESMSTGSNLVLSDNYDFTKINLPKPSDYNLESEQSYEWYTFRVEAFSLIKDKSETQKEKLTNDESLDKDGMSDQTDDSKDGEQTSSDDGDRASSGIELQLPDGTIIKLPNKSESGTNSQSQSTADNNGNSSEHPIENRDFPTPQDGLKKQDLSALWEEDSLMSSQIDIEIDKIQQSNSWGSLAGNISEMIIANTKARIDYRKVLSGFRASILSSKRHLTRMRPNRRSGFDNMGSIRRFNTKLLVAVDVSASVDSVSLSHFYSIIMRAFKYGIEHIDVVQFDMELSEPQSLEVAQQKLKQFTITGRGGTSFQPAFDYAAEHPEYDGLIIFTDGCAPEPLKPKRLKAKVAWVLNDEKNYQKNNEWMKKTGRCCTIKL
jgi:predicted metal-dependent peptidase